MENNKTQQSLVQFHKPLTPPPGGAKTASSVQNVKTREVSDRLIDLHLKLEAAKSKLKSRMTKIKKASKNSPANRLVSLKKGPNTIGSIKKHDKLCATRLSSLYDLKDSILRNIASYRLTSNFLDTGTPLTDLRYAHNICPGDYICFPDLIGSCSDKKCLYQHRSNYLMTDIDKLADILSYKPSLTGFKPDPDLSSEENSYDCRIKLKQYAAKLIANNYGKPVEQIARGLVKYVRCNKTEHELLTMCRKVNRGPAQVCNLLKE